MKDRWLKLWRSRPRLSRGWRTVRNLAVVLVCLYGLWALADYPLPTAELEFRRLEREHLMGPSDIQGTFRTWGQRKAIVGSQEDLVVLYDGTDLYCWPRQGTGAALIPVRESRALPKEILFVGVDIPQGTRSARLEGTINCWWSGGHGSGYHISALEGGYPRDDSRSWTRWARDYQAEGELLREGGVLFRVTAQEEDEYGDGFIEKSLFTSLTRWNTYRQSAKLRGFNCHMEAIFYGQDGRELGRAALSSPEDGDTSSVSG